MGNIDLDITANINGNNLSDGVCLINENDRRVPSRCFIKNLYNNQYLTQENGILLFRDLQIDNKGQNWEFYKRDDRGFFISNLGNSKVLTIVEGEEGFVVELDDFEDDPNQEWRFYRFRSPVYDSIQIVNVKCHKALETRYGNNIKLEYLSQDNIRLSKKQLFKFLEI